MPSTEDLSATQGPEYRGARKGPLNKVSVQRPKKKKSKKKKRNASPENYI